jgi:hypothetical protein
MMGKVARLSGHSYGTAVVSVGMPVAKVALFDGTGVHLLPMLPGMVLYLLITALFGYMSNSVAWRANGSNSSTASAILAGSPDV